MIDKKLLKGLSRSASEQYLVQEDILKGKYGPSGQPFMTTEKLAKEREVSVVTAHHIMTGLCENGYIELRGKKYYLNYEGILSEKMSANKLIGLIIPMMNNEFYSSISDRISILAAKNGYRVLVMVSGYSPKMERHIYNLLMSLSPSGLIFFGATAKENLELFQNSSIPHVMLGNTFDTGACTTVQVNSFTISHKVADHLVAAGYKKFLYVGNNHVSLDNDVRYTGYRMGLRRHGFTVKPEDVARIIYQKRDSYDVLCKLIEKQKQPVGVFCNNDLFASMLYAVCKKVGKRIPEDVGIVGFDDLSIATVLEPALTTIHYRVETMADVALQQIIRQVNNPDAGCDHFSIEPSLIIRESSCPQASKEKALP